MYKRIIIVTVLIIVSVAVKAQLTANQRLENDEAAIKKLLKEYHIPAIGIGIIRNGKLQQIKVVGELTNGNLAPYNTIFNVASLTKPVVAMLTLKLVSTGEWNLDEPIYKYWVDPDVSTDPRHKLLTTRHILTHQTGFVNWRWNHPTKKLTFDHAPGTKSGYSGEGFEYLRISLEKKFSRSLDKLADSLIFKPLKMNDTKFMWDNSIDGSRFALWHDTLGVQVYKNYKLTSVRASDNLLTTIEDYGNFIVACMDGFGLPKPLFDDMIKPHSKMSKDSYMGLGWATILNYRGKEPVINHQGSDKGVSTIVCWLPDSKDGVIIFTNGDNGWKVFRELVGEILQKNK